MMTHTEAQLYNNMMKKELAYLKKAQSQANWGIFLLLFVGPIAIPMLGFVVLDYSMSTAQTSLVIATVVVMWLLDFVGLFILTSTSNIIDRAVHDKENETNEKLSAQLRGECEQWGPGVNN